MLTRRIASNHVVYYTSPRLTTAGVPHAFSTRIGGTSTGAYRWLNFGTPLETSSPDSSDNIRFNHQLLLSAIKVPHRAVRSIRQVHGKVVIDADRDPIEPATCGDALVSQSPTDLLAVRTADCVPMLIASTDGRTVAAVHAGWRGIIADVIGETIRTIHTNDREVGLIAAIGPCIGFDHFEVGHEVVDQFVKRFPNHPHIVRHDSSTKSRIDLKAAARVQLHENGVADGAIDVSDRCTFAEKDEFYSHRRDRGQTGRMVALIGPKE